MDDLQRTAGRRWALRAGVAMFGLGVFGLGTAAAASLGGLTTGSLGAENAAVVSCDTDGVSIAYTNTYDATAGRYEVSSVTVNGLASPACSGKTIDVTLSDSGNTALGSGTATIGAGTSQVVAISPNADAEQVAAAAVVVYD